MKKLTLIIVGMLFIALGMKAQDTNTVVVGDNTDNIVRSSLELGLNNIQTEIDKKQSTIDSLSELIVKLGSDASVDYSNKIDSLEDEIAVNEDVIETLEDAMEAIEEAMDDIEDAMVEVQDALEDLKIELDDLNVNVDVDVDNGNVNLGTTKKRKQKKFKGHYSGMQLGLNSYLPPAQTIFLPGESEFMTVNFPKSFEFSLNPIQVSIPFFNRYFGAVTGLGFTWNNYELANNDIKLGVNTDGALTAISNGITYEKNRFKTVSMNVPLILELQIPANRKDKRFYMGGGIIGTMNMSGKMKTVFTENGSTTKVKDKSSNWPLTKFSYSATARVGYDDWSFYVNYSLVPLFEKNLGPELYPVSAGVSLRF